MEIALYVLLTLGLLFGAAHAVGISLLSAFYCAEPKYLHCKTSRWFAVRTIVLTGIFGFLAYEDKEFGLFWNRMLTASDAQRSNADTIQQVRGTLRKLRYAPTTPEVDRERDKLKAALKKLRQHDDIVAAQLALTRIKPDLTAAHDTVTAAARTQRDVAQLP